MFIRPNARWALSQREIPSNVVTLTERPAIRRPFMVCVLRALVWIMAQLVYGGKLQCEPLLRNPLPRKGSFMESFKCDYTSSVLGIGLAPILSNLLCTVNYHHSFEPLSQLLVMHNEKLSGSECKHLFVIACFCWIRERNKSTAAPLLFLLLRNRSRGLKVSACIKKGLFAPPTLLFSCVLLSKGCQTVWRALLHLHKEKMSSRSPASSSSLSYSYT